MTHVQKFWTAQSKLENLPNFTENSIEEIKSWMKESFSSLANITNDEQILLFLHSNYYNVEDTKKCIEHYYKLRRKATQFFLQRNILSPQLQKALNVLYYGIFPEKTPDGCQIVFHMLNDNDPSNYVFNDGFKLLVMMIDAVYAKEGPQEGLILVFDMKGVKLGHVIKLPLDSVRKSLEYLQEAIPVRLKAIHVLNVHSLIDKIMMVVKPFIKKKLLNMLHFHKNNEEIFNSIPRKCLPNNYGGELESVEFYHENFVQVMNTLSTLFIEEDELIYNESVKEAKEPESEVDFTKLCID